MSETRQVICGECGQLKPSQKLHCVRHDFVYNPGEHCDHCEDEFIKELEKTSSIKARTEQYFGDSVKDNDNAT